VAGWLKAAIPSRRLNLICQVIVPADGPANGVMPCLRFIRLRCNVSSRELARRIGTTHFVISVKEHEGRGSVATWQRALAALGAATSDLQRAAKPGICLRLCCHRLPQQQNATEAVDLSLPPAVVRLPHQGLGLFKLFEASPDVFRVCH
jgi:hypothetical protein